MTPQELRVSILQHAIQGKLVEQRTEEGTGEELFKQIQSEKQALNKVGKIKKAKAFDPISVDEIPFEIPETWKWARIGQIFDLQAGKNITASDILEAKTDSHKYLCYGGNGIRGFVESFNREGRYPLIGRQGALCGNINLAQGQFYATEHAVVVDHFDMCDVLWSAYFLKALNLNQYATATAQPGLSVANVIKVLIPLPPLAEQKRIVAKLEEILPLIDRYEAAWNKLEEFNKHFPGDMQKSILQLAIQGKLVEQRTEEGTGEELFQQIQAEKQALIKAGKIKKEKPLPEIAEDEIPFDIPDTWKWYRFGELFNIVNGFTPLKTNPEFWTDGDIPWFTIEDVRKQGRFISSTEKFITQKALSKNTERIVPADTVLLCCTASVGEYAYAQIPLTTNQQFNAFVVKEHYKGAVYPLYVFEYAKTLKGSLIDRAGKTTFNFVSVGKLSNMLIPIPPLAEQKRIVAKLEEILPLCERLK